MDNDLVTGLVLSAIIGVALLAACGVITFTMLLVGILAL